MNLRFILPIILLLASTCNKQDDRPEVILVRGNLHDAYTSEPLADVELFAYSYAGDLDDAWNGELELLIYTTTTTDEKGDFYLVYQPSEHKTDYLGTMHIPEGYQHWATQDGHLLSMYQGASFYDNHGYRLEIEDGGNYSIGLYPKASFSFALPPLTPELKQDTLVLRVNRLPYAVQSEHFYLGNPQMVYNLAKPRALEASNYASGAFDIRKDTVLRTGTFNVYCTPNDTTIIYLDF